MNVSDNSRGVVQDLVVPDLKAIRAKLEDLEPRLDNLQHRMSKIEGRAEKRFDEVMIGLRSHISAGAK